MFWGLSLPTVFAGGETRFATKELCKMARIAVTDLQCYFNHDKSQFVQETNGPSGHRLVQFQLSRGSITRAPSFYTIQGPRGRWYVDNMEIAAVRDLQARSC